VSNEPKARQLNPEWLEKVRAMRAANTYFKLLSMDIAEVSWGEALLEIELGPQHLQPYGTVHGGVISSLIDSAGFWAVYSMLPQGTEAATVEMKLNYLAPARKGRLLCQGRCIKLGRTLGLAEARVSDDAGELIAHGTVTLMIIPGSPAEASGLPPKHL
jgi:uncharacterized protein (TIGR00369 family)